MMELSTKIFHQNSIFVRMLIFSRFDLVRKIWVCKIVISQKSKLSDYIFDKPSWQKELSQKLTLLKLGLLTQNISNEMSFFWKITRNHQQSADHRLKTAVLKCKITFSNCCPFISLSDSIPLSVKLALELGICCSILKLTTVVSWPILWPPMLQVLVSPLRIF